MIEVAPPAEAADDESFQPLALHEVHTKGVALAGHHNRNFLIPLERSTAPPVKYRFPIPGAMKYDCRMWLGEEELLRRLAAIPDMRDRVPRVLRAGQLKSGERYSVHTYAEGASLEAKAPTGSRVPRGYFRQIADLFRAMAGIPVNELPPCPAGWPESGDTTAFFREHVKFTQRVFDDNYPAYGYLFERLGVPKDALSVYAEQVKELRPRPFVLLHGDLHRENIVIRKDDDRLFVLDWELAMVGDPLYDLATHLRLMRYPRLGQRYGMIRQWRRAVSAVDPRLAAGVGPGSGPLSDLGRYLGYKRIQAVHTDTMRAARLVAEGAKKPSQVAPRVRQVLAEAAKPLGLGVVPSPKDVVSAFTEWLAQQEPEAERERQSRDTDR